MVYVDNMYAPYRNMKMCHMIADSQDELLAMAKLIGVNTKWIQKKGTYEEHFDVCEAKRKLAVKNGAVEVTAMGIGRLLAKRVGHPLYQSNYF